MNITPPKLHRRSYWVWLNRLPDQAEDAPAIADAVAVEVQYSDQLRGELEMTKLGIDMKDAPMHAATVWVWCAMVRQGLYGDKFPAFKNRDLAELEPVADQDDDDETPDPT